MTVECLKFLSTPSARRATCFRWTNSQSSWVFLSTPSARRATCFQDAVDVVPLAFLSTPSARRATTGSIMTLETYRISIHALREEGDQTSMHSSRAVWIFLSTPSARRATVNSTVRFISVGFLSTPSARRATSPFLGFTSVCWAFLSTPSARRATPFRSASFRRSAYFYPRPPRGGRRPPPG